MIFLRFSSLFSSGKCESRDMINLARYSSADKFSFSFLSFSFFSFFSSTYSLSIFAVFINEISSGSGLFFFLRWVPPTKHFVEILEEDEVEGVGDVAIITSSSAE